MMQDTVLTLCKESVKEFVAYVLTFCPRDTKIISTKEVHNTFDKVLVTPEDSDYEEMPFVDVPEAEQDETQKALVELFKMFDKNKDPEPLFILDLVLKGQGQQASKIPTYSNPPTDIVDKIMAVFDEGIACLQVIPQLEPILLKQLFKTQGKKMLKAPLRPLHQPAAVDPNKKALLQDENSWLWEAYASLRAALTVAI